MEEDGIQDKCGVFGIWGVDYPAEYIYFGLHNLQHRGQESCGILTVFPDSEASFKESTDFKSGMGIVNDVFDSGLCKALGGRAGIGHVRYSTQGESSERNIQPIAGNELAIAHNGQFANHSELRSRVRHTEQLTTTDTELALRLIERSLKDSIENKIKDAFQHIEPSYALVMLTKNELIGLRDPCGVRPLVVGKIPDRNVFCLASETAALDMIEADYVREVKPGEMVIINNSGLHSSQILSEREPQKCIFEIIYFARPDSFTYGLPVTNSRVRIEFGKQLARRFPVDADVVIPIPDSSNYGALGYHMESGIPFDGGLIRSHYIGRSFIGESQAVRHATIRRKFNVDRSAVQGKSLVVVDDSIIRANTGVRTIGLLKGAGAKEIHLRITSPPYANSCYLGIDTADQHHLIAAQMEVEEICKHMDATSLGYLPQEDMLATLHLEKGGFCTYCFDGKEVIKRTH